VRSYVNAIIEEDEPWVMLTDEWEVFNHSVVGLIVTTLRLQLFVGLFNPASMKRDALTVAATIKSGIATEFPCFRWANCQGGVTDCCRMMKKMMRDLGLVGMSCPCHVVAKALEHMFKDVLEMQPIWELPRRLRPIHDGHAYGDYLELKWPGEHCKNAPAIITIRWTDVADAVGKVVAQKRQLQGFANERDAKGRPYYPATWTPFSDGDFAMFEAVAQPLAHTAKMIKKLQKSLVDVNAPSTRRSDGIFWALHCLAIVAVQVTEELRAAGFPESSQYLAADLRERLLKHPDSLKLQIKAGFLNPAVDAKALCAMMGDGFIELASQVEKELIETCRPRGVQAGLASPTFGKRVSGEANVYLRWIETAAEADLVIGTKPNGKPKKMTVTEYWEARPSPMAGIALKIAVFPTSGADIERLFSQARAAFDYFMGGCKVGTMSDRLFVKINRKMLKRLRIRTDVAPAAP
jgi:hypothetical protein